MAGHGAAEHRSRASRGSSDSSGAASLGCSRQVACAAYIKKPWGLPGFQVPSLVKKTDGRCWKMMEDDGMQSRLKVNLKSDPKAWMAKRCNIIDMFGYGGRVRREYPCPCESFL